MHKHLLTFALCISPIAPTCAKKSDALPPKPTLSPKTGILTAGAGITAGAATLYGLSWLVGTVEDRNSILNITTSVFLPIRWLSSIFGVSYQCALNVHHPKVAATLITAASLGAATLAAWLTYRYQPEGKYGRAHDTLKSAINNDTLSELISAEQTLVEHIETKYIHCAYPRVTAYNDFIRYHKALKDAIRLWHEAIDATDDQQLIQMARTCIEQSKTFLQNFERCISIIRNQPDWIEQLKGHDAMLARQAQERTAIATQQIAMNTTFR